MEDGFPTPPSGLNGGGATQATRFLVRFFNLPVGLSLSAPGAVHGHGLGGVRLSLTGVLGANVSGAGGVLSSDPHFSPVAASGGSAFVVYEVVNSNPFVVENVNVPIVLAPWPGGLPAMSVTLAPVSAIATSDGPAPEPRFADAGGGCPPHKKHGDTVAAKCPPPAPGHSAALMPDPQIVAALNPDGTFSGLGATLSEIPLSPARRGVVLELYGTVSGFSTVGPQDLPEVRIGGVPTPILSSGPAPGLPDVWKISVRVPDEAPTGPAVHVTVFHGGQELASIDITVE